MFKPQLIGLIGQLAAVGICVSLTVSAEAKSARGLKSPKNETFRVSRPIGTNKVGPGLPAGNGNNSMIEPEKSRAAKEHNQSSPPASK